jgi:hypothetical protein
MDLQAQARIGVQAGLLAGTVVAATFFVADLARLAPLTTPTALSCTFLGPCNMSFDTPVVVESLTIISFGGRPGGFDAPTPAGFLGAGRWSRCPVPL